MSPPPSAALTARCGMPLLVTARRRPAGSAGGDANAFLLSEGWMGMESERWVEGTFDRPTMIVTGYIPRDGHRFTFMAAFEFDPTRQPWHGRPYGFRFTFGTLTASGGRTADFDDPFAMLDTIRCGEDALGPIPARCS